MHEVTRLDVPQLQDAHGRPYDAPFCLATATATEMLRASMSHRMTYSFQEPAGMILGVTDDQKVVVTEGPATVRWRDETGPGWVEKNRRLTRS